MNYQVDDHAGRTVSGLLAVETPTSITLRRGDKAEDTILRSQIDEMRATSKSLMPEEFEKQLDKQQMADLIEYLLGVEVTIRRVEDALGLDVYVMPLWRSRSRLSLTD